MDDPLRYPDTGDTGDPGMGIDRESTTSTPRWVKVVLIIALVVVLLIVVGWHLTSGGLRGAH